MSAPHLLHVFATFGRGGPQIRFGQILDRCPKEWRHTVIAMDGDVAAQSVLPEGADVTVVDRPTHGSVLAMRRGFVAQMRDLRPDLVCTSNWGAIEAVLGAKAAGIPVVHHEDGFGPDELERRLRRRNWMRRFVLRGVRAVVVPSTVLWEIARHEWWVKSARLHLLPNGVDLDRFHGGGGGGGEPFVFGTVGGLRPEKNHELLLDAFARVPGEPRLIIVGDGPLRSRLEEHAVARGVQDRVDFRGPVADPATSYRDMDGFVLSSSTEQMPLCLLEAMASELPVVATDVGDVSRIVGEGAIVVPPQLDALTAAMAAMLAATPERRAEHGAANRARATEHYELATCMDAFVRVYEGCL